jgi:hypothetical protein
MRPFFGFGIHYDQTVLRTRRLLRATCRRTRSRVRDGVLLWRDEHALLCLRLF